jgi:hypothetical protein
VLKAEVGDAIGLVLNVPVVVLGVGRWLRRRRRRRRVLISIPRYRFRMSVLYVVGGDSVISGDEGSGVSGMTW